MALRHVWFHPSPADCRPSCPAQRRRRRGGADRTPAASERHELRRFGDGARRRRARALRALAPAKRAHPPCAAGLSLWRATVLGRGPLRPSMELLAVDRGRGPARLGWNTGPALAATRVEAGLPARVCLAKTTKKSAEPFVPDTRDLGRLRDAAASCRGCDLYARATQVVFGEGSKRSRMVLVGEQPGDA